MVEEWFLNHPGATNRFLCFVCVIWFVSSGRFSNYLDASLDRVIGGGSVFSFGRGKAVFEPCSNLVVLRRLTE